MRNGTDRDAPKPIEPPTGAIEVYTYDPKTARATLHLACGDDVGRAVTAMRKADGIACYARGGVVCGVKYGTPPSLVAPMKAAVSVAWLARTPVAARAAVEPPTKPTNADVEPAASSATPTDEEPMTTEAKTCERCKKHPAGGITRTTPKGTETWCAHCRRIESTRRNRIAGERVSQSAKASQSAKPTRKPAPKAVEPEAPQSGDPMAPLRAALDRLVARGGVDEGRVRAIVREELLALLVRPS